MVGILKKYESSKNEELLHNAVLCWMQDFKSAKIIQKCVIFHFEYVPKNVQVHLRNALPESANDGKKGWVLDKDECRVV